MFLMQVCSKMTNFVLIFFLKGVPIIYIVLGIDTDKYKYPIGSGRVTFYSYQSYAKAVAASFIEVKTPKFCKKVSFFKSCL